jgi:lipoyl(octanoyl) transferase
MIWRFLPYSLGNPAWNMAVDEAILIQYLDNPVPPTLRFYGWEIPTLSLGYFQEAGREVNMPDLKKRGFGFVRRCTGGRAVLHHRELTYSIIGGEKDGFPNSLAEVYLFISKALADTFRRFGVTAQLHSTGLSGNPGTGACFATPSWYEILVDNRKLVGSAQFRLKNSFLQHGSILVDFSAADLVSVLNLHQKSPAEAIADLEKKVTSFTQLGIIIQPEELSHAIKAGFERVYGIECKAGSLSGEEQRLIKQLMEEKYASDSWNLLRGNSRENARVGSFPAGNGISGNSGAEQERPERLYNRERVDP